MTEPLRSDPIAPRPPSNDALRHYWPVENGAVVGGKAACGVEYDGRDVWPPKDYTDEDESTCDTCMCIAIVAQIDGRTVHNGPAAWKDD